MNDIEMILRSRIEELERRLLESQARVHAAEAETVEQARLLGMSAERECALRAKLETTEARVKELEADNTRGAAYVQHLTTRVKELEAVHPDTVRLDWLQRNFVIFTVAFPTLQGQPIREVIDAARQQIN